jgi:hypothetical protein
MHMTSELKPSVVLLDLHRPEKHEFMTTFVNSSFRATANTFSCNGRRSKRASGELRRACVVGQSQSVWGAGPNDSGVSAWHRYSALAGARPLDI